MLKTDFQSSEPFTSSTLIAIDSDLVIMSPQMPTSEIVNVSVPLSDHNCVPSGSPTFSDLLVTSDPFPLPIYFLEIHQPNLFLSIPA